MARVPRGQFWETEFGKELSRVCPPECQRIIIDIPCEDIVRVYYQCCADKTLLELNWENALQGAEVISAKELAKGANAALPKLTDSDYPPMPSVKPPKPD